MSCPKAKRKWWPFHKWNDGVLHYPPDLSDGAGGCWAGEMIVTCTQCGATESRGIWGAESDPMSETGKRWSIRGIK